MTTNAKSAVDELSQWIEADKKAGLIELTCYPGSDREIGHEDAARLVLAMLKYEPETDSAE